MSLADHKHHHSRDVVFHEHIFPFANQNSYSYSRRSYEPQPSSYYDPSPITQDLTSNPLPSPSSLPAPTPSLPTTHTSPRPVRTHKMPSHLQDYVLCSPSTSSAPHCLATTTNLCLHPPFLPSFCLSSHNQ